MLLPVHRDDGLLPLLLIPDHDDREPPALPGLLVRRDRDILDLAVGGEQGIDLLCSDRVIEVAYIDLEHGRDCTR